MRKLLAAFFATLFTLSVAGAAVACPYQSGDKQTEKTEDKTTS